MCFCGSNKYGKYGKALTCFINCTGSSVQSCGGLYLVNSIYKTYAGICLISSIQISTFSWYIFFKDANVSQYDFVTQFGKLF